MEFHFVPRAKRLAGRQVRSASHYIIRHSDPDRASPAPQRKSWESLPRKVYGQIRRCSLASGTSFAALRPVRIGVEQMTPVTPRRTKGSALSRGCSKSTEKMHKSNATKAVSTCRRFRPARVVRSSPPLGTLTPHQQRSEGSRGWKSVPQLGQLSAKLGIFKTERAEWAVNLRLGSGTRGDLWSAQGRGQETRAQQPTNRRLTPH